MNKSRTTIVYENLILMATKYRKIQLTDKVLDDATLSTQLNHFEYVQIKGTRVNMKGPAQCVIFLIAPGSKYATKSMDFKKLLAKVSSQGNVELMVVTDGELTTHIKKYIEQFRAQYQHIHFECPDYEKFLAEMPVHVMVPPHSIASDEEVAAECLRLKTNKENFPEIKSTETQAVWLGVWRTQVVKIMRLSETVGVIPVYRYCDA